MLTNDFIFYYEKGFRANKLGIPAGIFSSKAFLKMSKVITMEKFQKSWRWRP